MNEKDTFTLGCIILILMLIGAITIIVILFKILKKIIDFLFNKKPKYPVYKEWNDFNKIILHTKTRIQVPLSQYIPNKTIYDVFMKNPYNDTNIKNMMIDILEHTKYNGPIPNIQYTLLGNEVSKHFTREIEQQSYIQITSEPKLSSVDLLALIIHECMHIYKFHNKIEYPVGVNQENIADILAVYLGFYKNLSTAHKFYTNQRELDYIYMKIYR